MQHSRVPHTGTDSGSNIRDAGPIQRTHSFSFDCSARCRLSSGRLGTVEQVLCAMRHRHPYAHEEEDGVAEGWRGPLPMRVSVVVVGGTIEISNTISQCPSCQNLRRLNKKYIFWIRDIPPPY